MENTCLAAVKWEHQLVVCRDAQPFWGVPMLPRTRACPNLDAIPALGGARRLTCLRVPRRNQQRKKQTPKQLREALDLQDSLLSDRASAKARRHPLGNWVNICLLPFAFLPEPHVLLQNEHVRINASPRGPQRAVGREFAFQAGADWLGCSQPLTPILEQSI